MTMSTPRETPDTPHARPEPTTRAIISRDGERALSAALSRLRHQLQVEFVERLREARSFGESSENDDYLQIKEEEGVLASRIERLESLLASATVFDGSAGAGASANVTIGSIVDVEDTASGEIRAHRLTGGYEPHQPNDISAISPIGRALLGRAPGDEVNVALPNGRQRALKINAVRARRRT
jgi:transcription elongation factor GreA